jgi:ATP-binding cassette, subfamily D (ALD), peroxisomal long-chain fatty acid import protein
VRYLTPPFGAYAAKEAALTGVFRQSHSRLTEYAEEIAFLGGEQTEKILIERDYYGLAKHISRVMKIRIWHGVVEEGIIK